MLSRVFQGLSQRGGARGLNTAVRGAQTKATPHWNGPEKTLVQNFQTTANKGLGHEWRGDWKAFIGVGAMSAAVAASAVIVSYNKGGDSSKFLQSDLRALNVKSRDILKGQIQDLVEFQKLRSELDQVRSAGGLVISFIGSSRPKQDGDYSKEVDQVISYIVKKHKEKIEDGRPIILLNGGPGKLGSAMDAVSRIKNHLIVNYGADVRQVFCDIKGGFPGEQIGGNARLVKMGFHNRQQAVVSGDELVVFPGGIGTTYELMEVMVARQLGAKGISVYDWDLNLKPGTQVIMVGGQYADNVIHLLKDQESSGLVTERDGTGAISVLASTDGLPKFGEPSPR